jgi:hypothetical protein
MCRRQHQEGPAVTGDKPIDRCPVCNVQLEEPGRQERDDVFRINCGNCGLHRFTHEALQDLPGFAPDYRHRVPLAFRLASTAPDIVVTSAMVQGFLRSDGMPSPLERVDLLLDHMNRESAGQPGVQVRLPPIALRARLACADKAGASWVIQEAKAQGLIAGDAMDYAITAKGWQRHAAWLAGGARTTHAFMAMRFGDDELDRVYRDHLVPAVAATGFELRTVNGPHQTAGSIDNRMRVEIRTSRFLVCDLTHGNRGAYWEAGFAEGLGRPVFYVCRADVLADRQHPDHPHFDTRQQLIITWDPADPAPGMQALKDAIRATLPDVARMED